MLPYTEEEGLWLASKKRERSLPVPAEVTPEIVAYYRRRGEQLRSEFLRQLLRHMMTALCRPFGRHPKTSWHWAPAASGDR